jgi:hypothetical protein
MRYAPLCFAVLAGCASVTPQSLQRMPIAEVCYLGTVEPDKQQLVADEVRRRNEDCSRHTAEINRIRDQEARAAAESGQGAATPGQAARQGSMGMGRY